MEAAAAAADIKLAEIAENFNCGICFDILVDPVVGNCGHDFCHKCLVCWFRQQERIGSSSVKCPVCRKLFSSQAVSDLAVCIRLRDMVETMFPQQLAARRAELQQQAAAEAEAVAARTAAEAAEADAAAALTRVAQRRAAADGERVRLVARRRNGANSAAAAGNESSGAFGQLQGSSSSTTAVIVGPTTRRAAQPHTGSTAAAPSSTAGADDVLAPPSSQRRRLDNEGQQSSGTAAPDINPAPTSGFFTAGLQQPHTAGLSFGSGLLNALAAVGATAALDSAANDANTSFRFAAFASGPLGHFAPQTPQGTAGQQVFGSTSALSTPPLVTQGMLGFAPNPFAQQAASAAAGGSPSAAAPTAGADFAAYTGAAAGSPTFPNGLQVATDSLAAQQQQLFMQQQMAAGRALGAAAAAGSSPPVFTVGWHVPRPVTRSSRQRQNNRENIRWRRR